MYIMILQYLLPGEMISQKKAKNKTCYSLLFYNYHVKNLKKMTKKKVFKQDILIKQIEQNSRLGKRFICLQGDFKMLLIPLSEHLESSFCHAVVQLKCLEKYFLHLVQEVKFSCN